MYYSVLVFLFAVLAGIMAGKLVIPFLTRLKFGQMVREEGPQSHMKKTGTPTMGGIIFFVVFLIGGFVFGNLDQELWFMIIFAFSFGIVGFLDDYLIILRKSNQGLSAKTKFLFLTFFAFAGAIYYVDYLGYPTWIGLEKYGLTIELGSWYYLFAAVLMVSATNAVNITDGIDGLSSSVTFVVSLFFIIYSYIYANQNVMIFSFLLAGSCIAFLFFNWHPAKVFLGDTGSLFLGGAVATLSIATKTEIILPLVGIIYVLETLSVIAQVISFKLFKRRIFKMSPIHHHFELIGWKEKKIVKVFSGVGFLFLILSLYLI